MLTHSATYSCKPRSVQRGGTSWWPASRALHGLQGELCVWACNACTQQQAGFTAQRWPCWALLRPSSAFPTFCCSVQVKAAPSSAKLVEQGRRHLPLSSCLQPAADAADGAGPAGLCRCGRAPSAVRPHAGRRSPGRTCWRQGARHSRRLTLPIPRPQHLKFSRVTAQGPGHSCCITVAGVVATLMAAHWPTGLQVRSAL